MSGFEQATMTAEAPVAIASRLTNPAAVFPEAWEGIQKLLLAVRKGGLTESTLELAHMRTSQINGCSACIEGTIRHARKHGVALDDRVIGVAGWRHSSEYTEAERVALELTEELTRLADRTDDPVPDGLWARATEHYDERALAALVLYVGLTNLFNRLNVGTRQPAGDW
jgi:AhpD family alkylhydroperoxidase